MFGETYNLIYFFRLLLLLLFHSLGNDHETNSNCITREVHSQFLVKLSVVTDYAHGSQLKPNRFSFLF